MVPMFRLFRAATATLLHYTTTPHIFLFSGLFLYVVHFPWGLCLLLVPTVAVGMNAITKHTPEYNPPH